MPIIQGAVAAASAGGKKHAAELSEGQRMLGVAKLNAIQESPWRNFLPATQQNRTIDVNRVAPTSSQLNEDAVGETIVDEEPRVCCFGCIQDEKLFRSTVMEFFEDPTSSAAAYWTSIVVFVCIVTSTLTIILESIPDLDNDDAKKDFFIVECICIAVFTIEYLVRIVVVENKCNFMIQPMNLVDLVAIMPFYIDLLLLIFGQSADDLSLLRLFRLARIFRIFKLSKHSSGVKICATAIMESRDTLGLMVFMLSIIVIVFASFAFFFEKGEWDENKRVYIKDGQPSKFMSIPASMWYTMVTVMTVGYGDMVPTSTAGHFMAAISMVCSIVIMALPISVIGANFSRAWMEHKEQNDSSNDGRQLSHCFDNVLDSLAEHNASIEEILQESSASLAALHKDLGTAADVYRALPGRRNAEGSNTVEPLDMQLPAHSKMKELVEDISWQEQNLQCCQEKVKSVVRPVETKEAPNEEPQTVLFKDQVERTREQGKHLESYILRYQEVSANIIGLEQILFGRAMPLGAAS